MDTRTAHFGDRITIVPRFWNLRPREHNINNTYYTIRSSMRSVSFG